MSRKFSRVQAGAKYQQELTAYIDWLTGKAERQPNIGTKGNRPASQVLYLAPFGYSLPSTILVQQSAQQAAWTAHEALFANRTFATLPSGDSSIKLRNYRAPRVNFITGRQTGGTPKTSHITKAKYLSYGGKSASIPFGKKSGDTSIEAAFAEIKGDATNLLVYLIPEKL